MQQLPPIIPDRFLAAYQRIARLARYERYLGAYIFGSLARGEATEKSDLDVHVVINAENRCRNLSHPIIAGVKLDISFSSLQQLKERTRQEMDLRERTPIIAESLIVFDKTQELAPLQAEARAVKPRHIAEEEYQFLQFQFFHSNEKVQRNLERDPLTALFAMHTGLNELLKYHYQLHQHWWVSNKRLLTDLCQWDLPLAQMIEQFVTTSDVQAKFAHWSTIIEHILEPLGGRKPISENNCDCEDCQKDLLTINLQANE